MAQFFIPTAPDTPNYIQRTTLDGREYLLRILHNQRENTWYLTLLNTQEEVIKAGIKIVPNWPLLRKFHYDIRVPPGDIFAIVQTTDDSTPGLGELGIDQRVRLVYFDEAEVASL